MKLDWDKLGLWASNILLASGMGLISVSAAPVQLRVASAVFVAASLGDRWCGRIVDTLREKKVAE